MNIWLLQTGERLPLRPETRVMRTGLLAKQLASQGHNVLWWTSAYDHYTKEWIATKQDSIDLAPLIKAIPLRGIGYNKNISLRRFVDHALVANQFKKLADQFEKPSAIVAALPDYRLAYAAFKYAKKHNIPFILDLRDRWPWDFIPLVGRSLRPFLKLALQADFYMARTLIQRSDILVTMMESWIDWARKKIGRPIVDNDRVYYLGSERTKRDPTGVGDRVRNVLDLVRDRWVILFVGSFTSRSWPKIATELAQKFESMPDMAVKPVYVLAGDGDFMADLEVMAESLSDVYLTGFVNDAEISELLSVAKVGLVTSNGDFEAVPNKVFTYLSGGVPILSSLGDELEQLIATEQIGFTCSDVDQSFEAIRNLIENEELRERLSENAIRIFEKRYESSRLYGDFANLITRFVANKQTSESLPGMAE